MSVEREVFIEGNFEILKEEAEAVLFYAKDHKWFAVRSDISHLIDAIDKYKLTSTDENKAAILEIVLKAEAMYLEDKDNGHEKLTDDTKEEIEKSFTTIKEKLQ
ncbi:MAG: hypothetical protein ACNFW9_02090 [Candidatus Kerfeldbacteria bacterium]|jgi:hypothetical protein